MMKNIILAIVILMFSATQALADDVKLKWDPTINATGYKIYSSQDMGKTWDTGIDTNGATEYLMMGVSDTGKVLFRVSAYNEHGESIRYTAGVWFCGSCAPPLAPSGVGIE